MTASASSLIISNETLDRFELIANVATRYRLLNSVYSKAVSAENKELQNSTHDEMWQIEQFFDQIDSRQLRKLTA